MAWMIASSLVRSLNISDWHLSGWEQLLVQAYGVSVEEEAVSILLRLKPWRHLAALIVVAHILGPTQRAMELSVYLHQQFWCLLDAIFIWAIVPCRVATHTLNPLVHHIGRHIWIPVAHLILTELIQIQDTLRVVSHIIIHLNTTRAIGTSDVLGEYFN